MRTLAHIVVSAIAVFVTARVLPGVSVDNFQTALVAAVMLGLVNAVLRPFLLVLTLPINILTLGLFTFVVMGFCVQLVSRVVPGFHVAGLAWAAAFGVVLSVVNAFLHGLSRT